MLNVGSRATYRSQSLHGDQGRVILSRAAYCGYPEIGNLLADHSTDVEVRSNADLASCRCRVYTTADVHQQKNPRLHKIFLQEYKR